MPPMKMKSVLRIGAVALPLLALGLTVGAARLSQKPVEVGLVGGQLRECVSASNCVCSEPASGDGAIDPLAFSSDAAEAFTSLVEFVGLEPRVEVKTVRDGYAHAVYSTRLLKFADDVEFRLDAASMVIHVRSASRVGRSDLGANRARIEDLRLRWAPPTKDQAR